MVPDCNVTREILTTVASHEGVDEIALDPPLFEVIDIDSLEELYAHSPAESTPPTVSFVYRGYIVLVNSPDEVEVRPEKSTV